MYYLKKLIISIFVLGYFASAQAQQISKPCLDTIHLFIEQKAEIKITACNTQNLVELVKKDLTQLKKLISINAPGYEAYKISYTSEKIVTISPSKEKDKTIINTSGQENYSFSKKCAIYNELYTLNIHFNELDFLLSDSFLKTLEQSILETTLKLDRHGKTYNYQVKNDVLTFNEDLTHLNGQLDMLSLKLGVGAGLIYNKPITDVSAEIGLQFAERGILKNEFYLSENMLFANGLNNKLHINTFVNIGYRRNFSYILNEPNWLGLEFGYLISRNGDFFEKNTFKIGFWVPASSISVLPVTALFD